MIYECPQCKTPLPAGAMACAKCGLQFATPIPADATVPPPGAAASSVTMETSSFLPLTGEGPASRRVLAAVVALGIVLVATVLFAIYSFTRAPVVDTSPPSIVSAPPQTAPGALPGARLGAGPSAVPVPAPGGGTAPIQLSGGSSSSAGGSATASGSDAALQGRWQAKNLDFYVFNADGSGSRGNASNPAKAESFTWVVTDNQLVLNAGKEERMTFSTGPDASVLYLRLPSGRYVNFARVSTT